MDIQTAVTQAIRTAAQAIAAILIVAALELGVEIDSAALTTVLTGVLSGVYAVIVTWLSKSVHPIFGYLSILPSAPAYADAVEVRGARVL